MSETVRVLPVNDLKPHLESAACKCAPRVESAESGTVVIHNAYDGREFYEGEEDESKSRGH